MKSNRLNSRKPFHLRIANAKHDSADLRGFVVYDKQHKKIGTVGEVYCDHIDLQPRYIEIIPLDRYENRSFLYPIECSQWRKNGPAFLESNQLSFYKYDTYDFDYIMQKEGSELITFNESLRMAGIYQPDTILKCA